MQMNLNNHQRLYDVGLRLAELDEEQGGWNHLLSDELYIENDQKRATAAILLENGKAWLASHVGGEIKNGVYHLNEAGRSGLLGGFTDHFFPIIRASLPTSPLNDIVAVQPTTRRQATIGYLDWNYGSTKGAITAGQKWIDAQVGQIMPNGIPPITDYSSEAINGESFAAIGGTASASVSGVLAWHSGTGIRPGSVVLNGVSSAAAVKIVDNGVGGFVVAAGNGLTVAGSVNYNTGAVSVTLTGGTLDANTAVLASYRWNSEAGDLPELDVVPRITMIETERRGLKTNVSAEGQFDFQMEFGLNYTDTVTTGAAALINYETALQAIALLWGGTTVYMTFDVAIPSGVTRNDHTQDLIYKLNLTSNAIWTNLGGLGYGNILIVDQQAAAMLATLDADSFQAAPRPPTGMAMGLHRIGTLMGNFEVYKFMHLQRLPGASPYGNVLMLWKGPGIADAGVIFAPYQAFYSTEPNQTADFVTKQGFASRYAMKLVNPLCQMRLSFTNSQP